MTTGSYGSTFWAEQVARVAGIVVLPAQLQYEYLSAGFGVERLGTEIQYESAAFAKFCLKFVAQFPVAPRCSILLRLAAGAGRGGSSLPSHLANYRNFKNHGEQARGRKLMSSQLKKFGSTCRILSFHRFTGHVSVSSSPEILGRVKRGSSGVMLRTFGISMKLWRKDQQGGRAKNRRGYGRQRVCH